jgi:hypothetical protein
VRRFQVIQAINREIRVALKTYTGQDVTTELGSTLARDILGALGEALMIDSPRDVENLPEGCVVVDKHGLAFQRHDVWQAASASWIQEMQLPVWLLLNPEWNNRES